MKPFAIISIFMPLIAYCAYLIAAHGDLVNVLHLAITEQAIILALLLGPIFALRHFDLLSTRRPVAQGSEPHLME